VAALDEVYIRFKMRIPTLANFDSTDQIVYVMLLYDSNERVECQIKSNTGTFWRTFVNPATSNYAATGPSTGNTYDVELHYKKSTGADGIMQMRVDGDVVINNTTHAQTSQINKIGFGLYARSGTFTYDAYFDDFEYAGAATGWIRDADLTVGDRYLISGVGTGEFDGKDNQIAHCISTNYFSGSRWTFSTPAEGWVTWVEDENALYYYTGVAWAALYTGTYTFFDPDKFPASPTSQSDHFDDASINAKWVDFNVTAGTTFVEEDHHLKITKTTNESGIYRGKYQTLPSGDFTITMKVGMITKLLDYHQFGLLLFEDATNNPTTCDLEMLVWWTSSGVIYNLGAQYWTAYNAWSVSEFSFGPNYFIRSLYMRIRQNGATWYFDISADGISWQQHYTRARRFTPAEFGFGLCNNTAVTQLNWIDWIYYEAADNALPLGGVRTVMLG
jgi:hypothetical protein